MAQEIIRGELPSIEGEYIKGTDDRGNPVIGKFINRFFFTITNFVPDAKDAAKLAGSDPQQVVAMKGKMTGALKQLRGELEKLFGTDPEKMAEIPEILAGALQKWVDKVASKQTQQDIAMQLIAQGMPGQAAAMIASQIQRDALEGVLSGLRDKTFEKEAGLSATASENIAANIEELQRQLQQRIQLEMETRRREDEKHAKAAERQKLSETAEPVTWIEEMYHKLLGKDNTPQPDIMSAAPTNMTDYLLAKERIQERVNEQRAMGSRENDTTPIGSVDAKNLERALSTAGLELVPAMKLTSTPDSSLLNILAMRANANQSAGSALAVA